MKNCERCGKAHGLEDEGECLGNRLLAVCQERDDALAKYEHVMGLLRDSKMKHGLCQPRSRKACTACNAKDEIEKMVAEWPGFTMVLS